MEALGTTFISDRSKANPSYRTLKSLSSDRRLSLESIAY